LPALPMRHAVGIAELVEHFAPAHAQFRLERPAWIVDARVDDFAVARTRSDADAFARLQHHDFPPAQRERPRDGEPDGARPDHYTFDPIHVLSRAIPVLTILRAGLLRVAQQTHAVRIV